MHGACSVEKHHGTSTGGPGSSFSQNLLAGPMKGTAAQLGWICAPRSLWVVQKANTLDARALKAQIKKRTTYLKKASQNGETPALGN